MNQKRLDRINELARKQKTIGLTEAEKAEQKRLRAAYLADFRRNLRGQLETISFVRRNDYSPENSAQKRHLNI